MPNIIHILYEDADFYAHAFKDTSQNSFRNYSIEWLHDLLYHDYRSDFVDEELIEFFIEHICNMSFDFFVLWLSQKPCTPPDEIIQLFRKSYYNNSKTTLALLENTK